MFIAAGSDSFPQLHPAGLQHLCEGTSHNHIDSSSWVKPGAYFLHKLSSIIPSRYLLSSLLTLFVFQWPLSTYGATVSLDASVENGTLSESATANFVSCIICDAYNNCRTENSGTLHLYRDAYEVCRSSGAGSASCTAPLVDTGCFNGTVHLEARATDACPNATPGDVVKDLTFSNYPSITIIYPTEGSTITGPFTPIAVASFTPEMNNWKGTISCGHTNWSDMYGKRIDCFSEDCTFKDATWTWADGNQTLSCGATRWCGSTLYTTAAIVNFSVNSNGSASMPQGDKGKNDDCK